MQKTVKPIPLGKISDEPLVSVWMTNYNYADFLDESINSVLKQTYSNFELIICDDGSTDRSLEIIGKYLKKDKRIKLIANKNGGIASALNSIYQISKGEIICFLDSDDYFAKTKIENVKNDFQNCLNCGVHFNAMMRINKFGKREGRYPLISSIPSGWLAETVIKNSGGILNVSPSSGISIRKEIAQKIFPLDIKLKSNIDAIIINLSLLLTPAVSNERILTYYRLHNKNLTNYSNLVLTPNEMLKGKKKNIELSKWVYHFTNEWISKNINEKIKLNDIENNWFYIEDMFVLNLLNKNKEEMKYWKKKLLNHQLTNKSKHLLFFYKISNFIPNYFLIRLLNIKYGQGKIKFLLSKILLKKH